MVQTLTKLLGRKSLIKISKLQLDKVSEGVSIYSGLQYKPQYAIIFIVKGLPARRPYYSKVVYFFDAQRLSAWALGRPLQSSACPWLKRFWELKTMPGDAFHMTRSILVKNS